MQNVTSSGTYTGTVSTSLNGGPETTSATSDGYVYTAPAVGYNPDITAGGSGVGKANRLSTSLTEFGTRGETSLSRIYTLDDKSWEIKLVSGANPTMVLRRLDAAGVVSGTANQTVALTSGFTWSIASTSLSGSTLGTINVLLRKSPNMAAPSFVHYTMPVAGGTPTLVTEITAAQGTTFCNASGGSTTQTNTGLNSISLQTARTSEPLATLSCYGLINSQNVNTSALVKIAANGTITKLIQYADWAGANRGVLGTFSGGSMPAPPTTAHIGAGDAALTILVSTYDPSGSMSTANISTSKIYRISKTGVVTSTVATNLVGKSASDYSYTFVALSKSDETVGYRMAAPQNMMSAPEVFLATVSATAVTMASTKITANTDAALTMAGTMFSFTTTGIYTSGQKLNVVRQMSTPSSRIVAIAALDVAGNSLASGQAVTMTGSSSVPGVTFSSMYDASGNLFLFYSDSTNATKVSTMKWNSLTPPVAATPTVTTQVSGKATNTPAAGTKLTITGTNLGSVTSVKFGNVTATIGTRSATSLEVTVPNGATGTVTITLVHASGSVTAGTYAYVGATKVAQKVVLNAGAATAKIGDADRTLTSSVTMVGHTAVAAVVYTSTTTAVCTVTAGKLKFVAAGTCTVKATQPGSGWAAEGVATYSIAVRKAQTVTINALTAAEKLVSVEGVYLYANATSGLGLTYTFSTPTVCAKGTFVVNHVINLKAGTCTIVVSQAGDTTWAAASATITYTVGAAGTATIVDPGNVASPVTLPINGTKVNVLSEVVSWNKTTGALNVSSRGIWVGPITATATFKIGTTDYTCKVTYGTQKGVTDATAKQVKGFPAANLCSGTSATDKAALAALKKVTAPVTVKIVVVRDLRNPASYNTKGQTTTRSIYVIIK
jgi:hypothetical protein